MYYHPNALPASQPRPAVAVLTAELPAAGGLAQLTPDGVFRARDGRPAKLPGWVMSPAVAERVLARLRARQTPIVVDYEHQTLLAEQNGQPAPAAGWIDPAKVVYREGEGLFAPIDWTERAAALIGAREYRFLSPVLPFDETSGEVLDLLHVALTNYPGIDGMASLAALRARFDFGPEPQRTTDPARGADPASSTQENSEVNLLQQLLAALGLPATTSEADALAGVAALKARADEAQTQIAALKAQTTTAPDLSQYVPKAMYEETRGQLAVLKAGTDSAEIDRLIEEGLTDGRIAGKATADYLRTQGLAVLKAHLADAPSIAALKGATQTAGKKPDGEDKADTLSEAELAVCKGMGLTPEKFKAART